MNVNEVSELFGYNYWANTRMVRAAEALARDQHDLLVVGSFPSVLATLEHIVGAEWFWLHQWMGDNPAPLPARPTLPELKAQLETVRADSTAFLGSLTDADLHRVVSHTGPNEASALSMGHLMRHVVNHSTYHRGQLSTQLRQLGHTPPNTDFTRYLYETAVQG